MKKLFLLVLCLGFISLASSYAQKKYAVYTIADPLEIPLDSALTITLSNNVELKISYVGGYGQPENLVIEGTLKTQDETIYFDDKIGKIVTYRLRSSNMRELEEGIIRIRGKYYNVIFSISPHNPERYSIRISAK